MVNMSDHYDPNQRLTTRMKSSWKNGRHQLQPMTRAEADKANAEERKWRK